jgi:hypothetical protein
MELLSCHPPGDWNFEVVPRVVENLWTPVITVNGRYEVTSTQVNLTEEKTINIMYIAAGIGQSVQRLARGWMARGLNPGGGEIFRTGPDRHWDPPSLLYNGYRVFSGGKASRVWR